MVERTLTPEENQVVNLMLIGVYSPQKLAFVLDTTPEDIENRMISIKLKWQTSTIRDVLELAAREGYLLFEELRHARKINMEQLKFYLRFLGDPELVQLTGSDRDKQKARTLPWEEIQLALKIAGQIARDDLSDFAKEKYRNSLLHLTENRKVQNEIIRQTKANALCIKGN